MTMQDVRVPQLGEGLTEVRLVAFLKQPGERVERDEPLYEMETDKAEVTVEAPAAGVLIEWLGALGDVLAIGAVVARIQVNAETTSTHAAVERLADSNGDHAAPLAEPAPATATADRARPARDRGGPRIPPRTRAHARQQGVDEDTLRAIPAGGATLMPEDVDRWLAHQQGQADEAPVEVAVEAPFAVRPVPADQRRMIYRLKRSVQQVVPATVRRPVPWDALLRLCETCRRDRGLLRPTEFQAFAWCAARAAAEHPRFRSTLPREEMLHEYQHVNLGMAVARADDELAIAVTPQADTLALQPFIEQSRECIRRARRGDDQADETVPLILTTLAEYGIVEGDPVLVSPAVAIVFVGAPVLQGEQTMANVTLTIDHRVINGVGAARFLQTLTELLARVDQDGLAG